MPDEMKKVFGKLGKIQNAPARKIRTGAFIETVKRAAGMPTAKFSAKTTGKNAVQVISLCYA